MGDLGSDNSSKTANTTENRQIAVQGNDNQSFSGNLSITGGRDVKISSSDPKLVAAVASGSLSAVEQAFGLLQQSQNRALDTVDSAVSASNAIALKSSPIDISAIEKEVIIVAAIGFAAVVFLVYAKK